MEKDKMVELMDSEIVKLSSKSFNGYIRTMDKDRLLGLLSFIYGYALKGK